MKLFFNEYIKPVIYLLFPILLILCILNIDNNYYLYTFYGVSVGVSVLRIIDKGKSIKYFFTTTKVKLLDKCITCAIYLLIILMFGKDIFIKNIDESLYWTKVIVITVIILTIISKRNFIKNLFKKKVLHR